MEYGIPRIVNNKGRRSHRLRDLMSSSNPPAMTFDLFSGRVVEDVDMSNVGKMWSVWAGICRSAAQDTVRAGEQLAQSVFGDYTIEEKQLLLKYGVLHGKDKSIGRRISSAQTFGEDATTANLRDGADPVSNARYGVARTNRSSEQA